MLFALQPTATFVQEDMTAVSYAVLMLLHGTRFFLLDFKHTELTGTKNRTSSDLAFWRYQDIGGTFDMAHAVPPQQIAALTRTTNDQTTSDSIVLISVVIIRVRLLLMLMCFGCFVSSLPGLSATVLE